MTPTFPPTPPNGPSPEGGGSPTTPGADRRAELLADRAVQGLSEAERSELEALMAEQGMDGTPDEAHEDEGFDLAAAAGDLAFGGARGAGAEQLPDALRARIEAVGRASVGAAARRGAPGPDPIGRAMGERAPPLRSPAWAAWSGWLAAAACLGLAVAGWWPRLAGGGGPGAGDGGTPAMDLAALRSKPGTVALPWSTAADYQNTPITGEVIWNELEGRGYMTFKGLPPLDPARNVYQLWVIDDRQPATTPPHGGMFTGGGGPAPAGVKGGDKLAAAAPGVGGEVVVPIDPKIVIGRPQLFAVTIEEPGGVWVSKREHLVLVAKPAPPG